ncbi:ribonuclease III [Peteryoungia desertarenae]|uniref:Ribonuclease 3 n=1 Tax=Peteryoungia desertarenae TaxID=1813451 RepID=A0ABX6QN39_9HYPH|nr:ribonuclease III [Peteryoungia desertarenae]QLF69943.1 ribonuclease III [Peteryoungia desertarenae]
MKKPAALAEEEWRQLEEAVGHRFVDRDRLSRALTHASVTASKTRGDYERLEFLGDRVLGLCIAELLFSVHSTATEGELSVRFNQLVSAETCAAIADELALHRFIRTGADVKAITAKNMLNVRADVVESLIAAIYLDAGLEAARAFILRHWTERARSAEGARRDAKTELQEWAHARHGRAPTYKVAERSGPDHDPRFTVIVEIPGVAPETGTERSKRAAEQVAATKLLEREGIWTKS